MSRDNINKCNLLTGASSEAGPSSCRLSAGRCVPCRPPVPGSPSSPQGLFARHVTVHRVAHYKCAPSLYFNRKRARAQVEELFEAAQAKLQEALVLIPENAAVDAEPKAEEKKDAKAEDKKEEAAATGTDEVLVRSQVGKTGTVSLSCKWTSDQISDVPTGRHIRKGEKRVGFGEGGRDPSGGRERGPEGGGTGGTLETPEEGCGSKTRGGNRGVRRRRRDGMEHDDEGCRVEARRLRGLSCAFCCGWSTGPEGCEDCLVRSVADDRRGLTIRRPPDGRL
eukprot:1196199-Prorocentrum_minimum.AAC.2